MTTQESISGIKNILSKLPDDRLISLAATVTQGLLKHKVRKRSGEYDIKQLKTV